MSQLFVPRQAGACVLAACLCFLAGCASTGPGERGDETRWQPQLLYLNRSPHSSLYVEVDAVAGTEPSDAVLEQLRQFLAKYCDKPGGIRIERDTIIPREKARGIPHEVLACRYLNGPPANSSNSAPAFIYILYYDSRLSASPAAAPRRPAPKDLSLQPEFGWVNPIEPHVHLLPFPGVIFIDRRFLACCPRSLEGLLLMHEAGHLLGLAQNPSHGVNNHCTKNTCLMQPKLLVDIPRALFSKQKTLQTNLCKLCAADLTKGRTGAPATNLLFVGPVLVCSEEGYCVATLPGELKILSGQAAKLDVAGFVSQMRQDGDHPEAFRELHCWTHSWGDLLEPREDWARQLAGLDNAKTDKLRTVRQTGTNAVAALQHVLAQAYLAGEGLPANETEAARWFRKAAESGRAESQNSLAGCYAQGKGVAKDGREAFNWYRKAAEQGYARAQCSFGECYASGKGVEQDPAEAARWFAKAAAGGDPDGQRNLGQALSEGRGVRRDEVEAYKWLSLAAEKADKAAAQLLAKLGSRLSKAQVRRGQARAAAFSRQGADRLNVEK
ncbi:MAG: hypothetical protein ABSH34_06240 [Verrucomicrobiota bacterium]|jgi:hypothetical protein